MISRWEMALIFAAAFGVAATAFFFSSYGHALLTGQCRKDPAPEECHRVGVRSMPGNRPH
jgi:hypothetical protein